MNDALTSWNDTPTREAVLRFVAAVTDPADPRYVAPADRIATFDNDGTLWCEKPAYIQLFFAIQRLKEMASADPSLLEKPTVKAAAEDDISFFAGLYPQHMDLLMEAVFDSHSGMLQEEFEQLAYAYLSETVHPRFGVPYKACIYQPMVELMHYLRAHDFRVFIASAGGMSFVRTVCEEIYELPRENVIGSNITFQVERRHGQLVLARRRGLVAPPDDGPGKPVNIELHVGRPPILAAGNANGDTDMFEFAQSSGLPFLNLLLRHDDPDREYAYDSGAEGVLARAMQEGWMLVSMKSDFRRIFAFQA